LVTTFDGKLFIMQKLLTTPGVHALFGGALMDAFIIRHDSARARRDPLSNQN
jgi:hypothetical protein